MGEGCARAGGGGVDPPEAGSYPSPLFRARFLSKGHEERTDFPLACPQNPRRRRDDPEVATNSAPSFNKPPVRGAGPAADTTAAQVWLDPVRAQEWVLAQLKAQGITMRAA